MKKLITALVLAQLVPAIASAAHLKTPTKERSLTALTVDKIDVDSENNQVVVYCSHLSRRDDIHAIVLSEGPADQTLYSAFLSALSSCADFNLKMTSEGDIAGITLNGHTGCR